VRELQEKGRKTEDIELAVKKKKPVLL